MKFALACSALLLVAGCTTLPPGSDYPKSVSNALTRSEPTRLARELAAAKAEHPGTSGFKLLPVGIDGFLLRPFPAQALRQTMSDALARSDKERKKLRSDARRRTAD